VNGPTPSLYLSLSGEDLCNFQFEPSTAEAINLDCTMENPYKLHELYNIISERVRIIGDSVSDGACLLLEDLSRMFVYLLQGAVQVKSNCARSAVLFSKLQFSIIEFKAVSYLEKTI
jgi:hypothetical protein